MEYCVCLLAEEEWDLEAFDECVFGDQGSLTGHLLVLAKRGEKVQGIASLSDTPKLAEFSDEWLSDNFDTFFESTQLSSVNTLWLREMYVNKKSVIAGLLKTAVHFFHDLFGILALTSAKNLKHLGPTWDRVAS